MTATPINHFLDSRDFYELMQTYRHTPIDAVNEFEAVKAALRAALAEAQPVQPASTDKHWCETCDGIGTIDETLGGEHFSNPKAECPDCDGNGYWIRRSQPVQPTTQYELVCAANGFQNGYPCIRMVDPAMILPFGAALYVQVGSKTVQLSKYGSPELQTMILNKLAQTVPAAQPKETK